MKIKLKKADFKKINHNNKLIVSLRAIRKEGALNMEEVIRNKLILTNLKI